METLLWLSGGVSFWGFQFSVVEGLWLKPLLLQLRRLGFWDGGRVVYDRVTDTMAATSD